MKILVTGANGQLGNEIKDLSPDFSGWEFCFTDIEDLDLCSTSATEKFIIEFKPDYLINCAAYTAVDKAETDGENASLLNSRVPELLANLSTKYSFKLIHISTDYVFSGNTCLPLKEDDETSPPSVYGKTKLEGESLVQKESDAIIIRTSWLYSKYGNNFVRTMLRLGSERETLSVVFDQIGTPTNACDLATTILNIISQSQIRSEWKKGIYHFSNEGVCSWYDFAIEIMKFAGIKCKILPIESKEYPVPAPRPPYSVMNKQKIKATFALEIPFWRDSLQKTVAYISDNK